MSWAVGRNNDNRWVGYGVPAICDHPRCTAKIDRGLGYICGGHIDGGDNGCGRFFCGEHLRRWRRGSQVCTRCANYRDPYPAKPDTAEWLRHILSDPTWAEWRTKCRDEYVEALTTLFAGEAS